MESFEALKDDVEHAHQDIPLLKHKVRVSAVAIYNTIEKAANVQEAIQKCPFMRKVCFSVYLEMIFRNEVKTNFTFQPDLYMEYCAWLFGQKNSPVDILKANQQMHGHLITSIYNRITTANTASKNRTTQFNVAKCQKMLEAYPEQTYPWIHLTLKLSSVLESPPYIVQLPVRHSENTNT